MAAVHRLSALADPRLCFHSLPAIVRAPAALCPSSSMPSSPRHHSSMSWTTPALTVDVVQPSPSLVPPPSVRQGSSSSAAFLDLEPTVQPSLSLFRLLMWGCFVVDLWLWLGGFWFWTPVDPLTLRKPGSMLAASFCWLLLFAVYGFWLLMVVEGCNFHFCVAWLVCFCLDLCCSDLRTIRVSLLARCLQVENLVSADLRRPWHSAELTLSCPLGFVVSFIAELSFGRIPPRSLTFVSARSSFDSILCHLVSFGPVSSLVQFACTISAFDVT